MLYLLVTGAAILLGCLFWRFGRSNGTRKLTAGENSTSKAKPGNTKPSVQANGASMAGQSESNEHTGDQRILEEYPWESYKKQLPAMQQAMELVVFRSLLLNFTEVSYDVCSTCLQSHDGLRDLFLEGWRKGSFELLRNNVTFLSLIEPQSVVSTDRDGGEPKQEGDNKECHGNKDSKNISGEHTGANDMLQGGQEVNVYGGKFINTSGGVYNVAGDVWRITYSNDDSRRIAEWFISIDYRATHNEIAKKRSKNTGGWLLKSETYGGWCSTQHRRILWCPGIPGVGKTVMASLVVDHLRTFDESQIFVGIIYFNYKLRSQQSKLAILEALCRQMFELHRPPTLLNLYDLHDKQRSRPTETDLRSILSTIFREFSTCFLVLDALDEFAEHYSDKEIREVMKVVLSLGENVKLLVTSRVLGEMTATFEELRADREEIIAHDADMRTYLAERVTSLKSKLDFEVSVTFSEHIIEKVIGAAKGRFLVAELGMNLLAEQLNLGDLEDALDHLPHEIDETYVRVMELIRNYPDSRRELALKALMWVAYASRPLSVGALQHALATKYGKKGIDKYITPLSTITSLCAGLIVVQEPEWHYNLPHDERLVRFVHFTTQEFFSTFLPKYFPEAHKAMFSTCIEYLAVTGNHILPADFDWHPNSPQSSFEQQLQLPFYDYAALYWGYHANTHHVPLDKDVQEFLSRNDRSILLSCSYILRQWYHGSMEHDQPGIFLAAYHDQSQALFAFLHQAGDPLYTTTQTTPLHIAAIAGRTNTLKEILQWSKSSQTEDSSDICPPSTMRRWGEKYGPMENIRDLYGRTPLTYAATYGHEPIAKLLIEHGTVELDSRDDTGMTPFACAAQFGSVSIMELLLSCEGIQVDSKDEEGRTPFSHAAWSGNHTSVTLLLARGDVEVDSKDHNGRTALSYVAQYGNEQIVKVLLEHGGVEVDSKANNGRTPFSYAAQAGHEPIIKLLLDHGGVQVDLKDDGGRTPFSYAAEREHESIIKLLLEHRAVEVGSKDNYGRTPLSFAAEHSSDPVIQLLLEDPGVVVDSRDGWGRTPFSYAAERGSDSTVSLLLQSGGIEVNSKDSNGRTPFSYATSSIGRIPQETETVLKLLLRHPNINIDLKDNQGRTPLSYAAERGLEQAVKLLLQHGGVKVDPKDDTGRTPFSYAVGAGKLSIIMLFLEHGDFEVDSKDIDGRTPLLHLVRDDMDPTHGLFYHLRRSQAHRANETDEESIVNILLKHGVMAEARGANGRTPFSYAAASGKELIMKLLLEDTNVEVESKDKDGRTPFSHAAERDQESTIKLLLQGGDIEVDSRSKWGRTPFSYAAEHGAESVARFLLKIGADPDSVDNNGRTPVSYAAQRGQEPIVRLLLDSGRVKIDSKDAFGRTPFLYAAERGAGSVVKLLGEAGVDMESKDERGRTPFSYAATCSTESTMKLLLTLGDVNYESKDDHDRTTLPYAAWAGDELTTKLPVPRGIEVDARDDSGRTPFSYAAQFGGESAIRLLLQHGGIEVDSKDNLGHTPLSYAAQMGNTLITKLILEQEGVDINAQDSVGRTPFMNTVFSGREETARLLLEHGGVMLDSKDISGCDALALASYWDRESIIRLILDQGDVNVDSKDLRGRTPLSHAAEHGKASIVKLLIEHGGANVHTQDKDGRNALSWASSEAHWWDDNQSSALSTIQIILAQGIDVNLADNEGRTPLSYAREAVERYGESFQCVVDLLEASGAVELPSSIGVESAVTDIPQET